AVGTAIGFLAGVRRRMDLEQWTVGGRGFGVVLVFLLTAGEVYTTFAFLGASGWAYSRGGPTLYVLAYLTLAYVVSFFILPPVWELGRKYALQTLSDFFGLRYRNRHLAGFVCIVGIACFVPYLQLQITGVGIIVSVASADALRRNAVVMPLYTLTLAFIFFAGFATVLLVPGLANGDLALLTVVRRSFPPWFLGVVGGAGALTAMVPAAILILTAATLFAKNLYRPLFAPAMTDDQVAKLARAIVVVLGLVSLILAAFSSTTLVSLLLMGYAGVTQFFPGVVLGLYWPRVSTRAVFAGMIAGVVTAVVLMLSHRDPWFGVSAGFLALCLNFLIVAVVTLATPAPSSATQPMQASYEA